MQDKATARECRILKTQVILEEKEGKEEQTENRVGEEKPRQPAFQ